MQPALTLRRAWTSFTLAAELGHATDRPPQSTALIERARRRAITQWRAARVLMDSGEWRAAREHYAQTLALCMAALTEHHLAGSYADTTASLAWHNLVRVLPDQAEQLQARFPGLAEFMTLPEQPVWAGRPLPGPDAPALDDVCDHLVNRVEMLVPGVLHRARFGRVAGVAAIAAATLFQAGVWVSAPSNLARHAKVTASSQRPGSPKPGGVANGVVEASYGLHTAVEERPWVELDMGASHPILRVVVFPRGDGWWHEGLPLILELVTQDGTVVQEAIRSNAFTPGVPWEVILPAKVTARTVRLRVPSHGYIALAEVQVFSR